ncbi:AP-3 complex subunit delta-1 [Clonorchis sinensis]|uniref:AP-3 complex subunit delta-1 n=1 Tax=Clonorchis sinensis TaxID=79923 RepID=G7YKI8_CLOSI|nr:AP-3 complex subunit delta-1 [Clonorchis sinensis]
MLTQANLRRKKAGTISAGQLGDHVRTNTIIVVNSMVGYQASFRFTPLATFLTREPHESPRRLRTVRTNSTKPYLRKKAVLLLYKVFLNHPEALRICFPRLKEKLEDPDPGVQSAAVNVICELARKNPKNYLSLAPVFFKLMTSSTNNWVLIKIIKLFGALTPIEPRLGKKLIEPLTNLIHSTSAMSLLYECINTVIAVLISISSGVPNHQASIQLCVQKLRILIEDSDQNLKYLGLLAMTKILRYHPKSVQSHKDLIFRCLDDKDESIRLRALNLLHGMVSKQNLIEIVKFLTKHVKNVSGGNYYRNELVTKIVHICSQENYHYVTSFEWYITVLVELALIDGVRNGELLAAQLMDVAIRVPSVQLFCVTQMALLLDLCTTTTSCSGFRQGAIHEVVHAASWICAEYGRYLENPRQTLEAMLLAADRLPGLPTQSQAILLLNSFKLFCTLTSQYIRNGCQETPTQTDLVRLVDQVLELTNFLEDKLTLFVHSPDLEVQERAVSLHQLLSLVVKRLNKISVILSELHQSVIIQDATPERGDRVPTDDINLVANSQDVLCSVSHSVRSLGIELGSLFAGEINPVAPKAQQKVPLPEGLDLEACINPAFGQRKTDSRKTPAVSDHIEPLIRHNKKPDLTTADVTIFPQLKSDLPKVTLTEAQVEEMRQRRLEEQKNNPHYLKPALFNGHQESSEPANNAYQALDDHKLSSTQRNSPQVGGSDSGMNQVNGTPVRGLARSDQFAEEIQQRFAELAVRESKSRSRSSGVKKLRKTKRSGCQDFQLTTEGDEDISKLIASPIVRRDLDMPEGILPDDQSSTEAIDPNDPHHRLSIPLDDLINAEPSVASKSQVTSQDTSRRTRKNTSPRMASPGPSPSLSSTPSQARFVGKEISPESFSEVLSNTINDCSRNGKVRCPATVALAESGDTAQWCKAFRRVLRVILKKLPCYPVEIIDSRAASLYTERESLGHPVCILVKLSIPQLQTAAMLEEDELCLKAAFNVCGVVTS